MKSVTRCTKVTYPNRRAAAAAALVRQERTGELVSPYLCPDGRHWHLTPAAVPTPTAA